MLIAFIITGWFNQVLSDYFVVLLVQLFSMYEVSSCEPLNSTLSSDKKPLTYEFELTKFNHYAK